MAFDESSIREHMVSKYIPRNAGEVVYSDISSPDNHSRQFTAVLYTDRLARFCDGSIPKDSSREIPTRSITKDWFVWMGPQKRLFADSGTNFPGIQWSIFSTLYGLSIVVAPSGSHRSVGMVERQIQSAE